MNPINFTFVFYILTLFLASMLAGLFVHEGFHLLTMKEVSSITLYIGENKLVSICCLTAGESANEGTAYILQAITVLIYFVFGYELFLERKPSEADS